MPACSDGAFHVFLRLGRNLVGGETAGPSHAHIVHGTRNHPTYFCQSKKRASLNSDDFAEARSCAYRSNLLATFAIIGTMRGRNSRLSYPAIRRSFSSRHRAII